MGKIGIESMSTTANSQKLQMQDVFSVDRMKSFTTLMCNLYEYSLQHDIPTDAQEFLSNPKIKDFMHISHNIAPLVDGKNSNMQFFMTSMLTDAALAMVETGKFNDAISHYVDKKFQNKFFSQIEKLITRVVWKVSSEIVNLHNLKHKSNASNNFDDDDGDDNDNNSGPDSNKTNDTTNIFNDLINTDKISNYNNLSNTTNTLSDSHKESNKHINLKSVISNEVDTIDSSSLKSSEQTNNTPNSICSLTEFKCVLNRVKEPDVTNTSPENFSNFQSAVENSQFFEKNTTLDEQKSSNNCSNFHSSNLDYQKNDKNASKNDKKAPEFKTQSTNINNSNNEEVNHIVDNCYSLPQIEIQLIIQNIFEKKIEKAESETQLIFSDINTKGFDPLFSINYKLLEDLIIDNFKNSLEHRAIVKTIEDGQISISSLATQKRPLARPTQYYQNIKLKNEQIKHRASLIIETIRIENAKKKCKKNNQPFMETAEERQFYFQDIKSKLSLAQAKQIINRATNEPDLSHDNENIWDYTIKTISAIFTYDYRPVGLTNILQTKFIDVIKNQKVSQKLSHSSTVKISYFWIPELIKSDKNCAKNDNQTTYIHNSQLKDRIRKYRTTKSFRKRQIIELKENLIPLKVAHNINDIFENYSPVTKKFITSITSFTIIIVIFILITAKDLYSNQPCKNIAVTKIKHYADKSHDCATNNNIIDIICNYNSHDCIATFQNKQYKVLTGKKGLTENKVEGDKKTPIGEFYLYDTIFYRADKIKKSELISEYFTFKPIEKNYCWCQDSKSPFYNQFIDLYGNRKCNYVAFLQRKDELFDIIVPITYNVNPAIPKKGSAVFLHTRGYGSSGTFGCVRFYKKDLLRIISRATPQTKVLIRYLNKL